MTTQEFIVNAERWVVAHGTDLYKEFVKGDKLVTDLSEEAYHELVNIRKWLVPAEQQATAQEEKASGAGSGSEVADQILGDSGQGSPIKTDGTPSEIPPRSTPPPPSDEPTLGPGGSMASPAKPGDNV